MFYISIFMALITYFYAERVLYLKRPIPNQMKYKSEDSIARIMEYSF